MTLMKENFDKWLEANIDSLKPPVCNKLMFGGQLKIMFIGGKSKNERMDYHIEDGEELFYQLKGDMVLKVFEQGKAKDVVIREGECFLLPPRIPHSPQRTPGTIGLVVERDRREHESDGLRWYVPGTSTVLWEKFFHCYDLGKELGPVIGEFQSSEAAKSLQPNLTDGTVLKAEDVPVKIDVTTIVPTPLHVPTWLRASHGLLGGKNIAKGEDFEVTFYKGPSQTPLRFSSQEHTNAEVYIYQIQGEATLTLAGEPAALNESDMVIVPPGTSHHVKHHEGSVQMQLLWWSA